MKHSAMKIRLSILHAAVLCAMLSALAWAGCNPMPRAGLMPQTPPASKDVITFDLQGVGGQENLLALVSLQGLVNRVKPQIFTYSASYSEWPLRIYRQLGYVTSEEKCDDVTELLDRFRGYYKGVVVYDPDKRYTVNLASNIAGVEDRIIIAPSLLDGFREKVDAAIDVRDLRDLDFSSQEEAFDWYRVNIFPQQDHRMLGVAKDVYMYDVFRDYLIACKSPTFWLPGEGDDDYSEQAIENVLWLYRNTPPNIPVFGFWPGLDKGRDVGYNEFFGTKLSSQYGKFHIVSTWVGNYSYHSGVQAGNRPYRQDAARAKKFRTYDPSKKYVALVMVESGDAPGYFQFDGFFPRQWEDPERGQVPTSYVIGMSLATLMPGVMRYMYDTATENDYFFSPGAGYCYPFLGLCDSVPDKELRLKEYFEMSARNMKALDMDMLQIYTFPERIRWSGADSAMIRRYVAPLRQVRSIISGMHLTGYTPSEGSGFLGDSGLTVHHVMTHWSWDDWDLFRTGTAGDETAARFLEQQIREGCEGTGFVTAMFYSWHYGPRRLNIAKRELEKEGYEFVTMDEFDYLFRESKKRDK